MTKPPQKITDRRRRSVLKRASEDGCITAKDVAKICDISLPSSHQLLQRLEELGQLRCEMEPIRAGSRVRRGVWYPAGD